MKRKPAVAGGEAVWSSFGTIIEAQAFLLRLPQLDKASCKVCLPAG
ncbi:hypothetical protein [Devosia riboflavina]|nr:hypothetical protein [Devosia riboflavina]